MQNVSDDKMRKTTVSRYGWLVLLMSFVFIAIIACILKIKYVEGDMWRELGVKARTQADREVRPNRGNIYADDGRLLATSEPLYGIYVDFMAEGIVKDTLIKYVGPLSDSLAIRYPDRTSAQYKKIFMDGWALSRKEKELVIKNNNSKHPKKLKLKSRYVRIIRPDINYLQLKDLRRMPFLKQRSNRSGMIAEEKTMRLKPFGRLAGRTVGSIYKDFEMGGASGLELKFDSILRGVPGIKTRQHVQGRWIDVVDVEPKDGFDLQTTINVDMQDIAEHALYDKLVETGAESGCAILMEVSTGEIKALVNLDRMTEGVYAEGNPNAFSYMSEPGSTFKTLSLMVALEDGIVTPDDSVYVGNGLFEYKNRIVRDHDWRHGVDKGYLTITRGMETSSNVTIAKMILKGYEKDPQRYAQRLHDLGITTKIDWDVPLKGKEGTAAIRFPDDSANPWSKTTLAWMSFGYETQIPPIYMLMFYNGIANDGKMIKPFIAKAYLRGGSVEERFKTEVINPKLCSKKTLKEVQEILRGVVTNGTGKAVNSQYFPISGKTGTAMIASGGGYNGYYVSFCGYFPSDAPRYTCFVGIRRPHGSPSGGLMPGAVFKRIAEGVYTFDLATKRLEVQADTVNSLLPKIKNGLFENTEYVLDKLDIKYDKPRTGAKWVSALTDSIGIKISDADPIENLVPKVIGMGARDALFVLEKAGLLVSLHGSGHVYEQSIAPGTKLIRGSHITISLK